MKLSEYIEKFGDKQVDVDKLSEFIIEDKVFVPKEYEKYYFVGYVGEVIGHFNDDSIDKTIIDRQQVYRTDVEAEFARDKAIFLEFMRKQFLRNSDELDWKDAEQYKFSLDFGYQDDEILMSFSRTIKSNFFYTTNKDWLKIFIDAHEDNIKKYYFEVKEWLSLCLY